MRTGFQSQSAVNSAGPLGAENEERSRVRMSPCALTGTGFPPRRHSRNRPASGSPFPVMDTVDFTPRGTWKSLSRLSSGASASETLYAHRNAMRVRDLELWAFAQSESVSVSLWEKAVRNSVPKKKMVHRFWKSATP